MDDGFDFWNDHSEKYLIMANLWDRRYHMQNPDGIGHKTGDCGDSITMYLSVKDGLVEKMSFELSGCVNTNACSNVVALLVEGKSLEEGWKVTPADVTNYLETLPSDHHHCAELAVGTLYLALTNAAGNIITGEGSLL